MLSKKTLLLTLLATAPFVASCAMPSEGDIFSRVFGEPTEKNIVNVPHLPLAQLLDQEKALRRYRNPSELFEAIQMHFDEAKPRALPAPEAVRSVLKDSYVYRIAEDGLSFVKLGSSELPVRVLNLPFTPQGIYTKDETLLVTGTGEDKSKTVVARINISAPAAPKLEGTLELDGALRGVRFTDKTAFFVLQGAFQNPFALPTIAIDGKSRSYDFTSSGCNCPALYGFTRTFKNPSFLHVLTLDLTLASTDVTQQIIALNEDQEVVLGEQALYIVYAPQLRESDIKLEVLKNLLVTTLTPAKKLEYSEIVDAPEYVLQSDEKREKQLMYLESAQRNLSSSAQEGMEKNIQIALDKQTADYRKQADVTMMHKLRFDTGKLQYVSAVTLPGKPLDTTTLGETSLGTWFVSRSKLETQTGTLLHTLDSQMQQQGEVFLDALQNPQVRRDRDGAVWFSESGSDEVRIINVSDLSAPVVVATRRVAADARLVRIDDTKSIQVSKVQDGLAISLLDTSGEVKVLATTELKGSLAYSRFFESLTGALYVPEKKMLVLHIEESRRAGNAGAFDGVMVFIIQNNTIEKKAEFDLRKGIEGQQDVFDIQISQISDNEVAVLYGKTASSIDLTTLQETSRKVLR